MKKTLTTILVGLLCLSMLTVIAPITQASADYYEPDNSFTQYSSMTVTTYVQSQARSIDPSGDNDYIRFYVGSSNYGVYTFYSQGSTDTYGHLYNSGQTQLASDDDSGGSLQFRIQYTISSAGYYFLRVRGYSSGTVGTYTLCFSYAPSSPPPTSGDSYEPDNSFTQYSSMTVTTSLQSQSRSIEPTNDNDYIRFYANSGTYTFYTQSSIDTYGHLYTSSQSQLAADDDSGGNLQFRIVYTISSSGYYFLRVRGYSSSIHGPYTLYFSYVPSAPPPPPPSGDSYEPDNSFTQYSSMTVTTSLQSQARSINPAGDNDYIRFQASAGTYTFYTSSSIDTYGHLYDSSQNQLASDDDSGGSYQFRIVYIVTGSGYYFLRVRGYSSSTTGAYTLYFSYQPSAPPPSGDFYEPDNSFSQYSTMTVTTSLQFQSRTIEPTNDNDYIRFYVSSSNYGVYTFYTQSFIDTYGYLYNSAQSQLALDDDSGGAYQFRIFYTISASGYYFLRVRGYSSSIHGIYTLYYSYVPQNVATPLPLRSYILGTLTGTGDADYYQVQVESGRRLRISLDGQNDQNFDLYVTYGSLPSTSSYDASGATASANEFIEISSTQGGSYYLLVRSSRGSGRYVIEPYYALTDVYVEVDYMSGYAPRTEVLTYLTNYYRDSFNIQVHITPPTEVSRSQLEGIGVSPDSLTNDEKVLIEQNFHNNPTYIYVFYASSFAVEGSITSDTLGVANSLFGAFLAMDRINSILNYITLLPPVNLERVVLLHEVGHCVGVEEFNLGSGSTFEELYCSNGNCVMSQIDLISALVQFQLPSAWDSTPEYCAWHASMIGRWIWSTDS